MVEKCGIAGLGNMGIKHLKCLMEIEPSFEICVFDINNEKTCGFQNNSRIKVFHDEESFVKYVDAIIVATSSEVHKHYIDLAQRMGKHILVEKPLCVNRREYYELKKYCKSNSCIQVNHIEEYRKAFKLLKAKAKQIQRIEVYRSSKGICNNIYSNVILDLLPHDMGIIINLMDNQDYLVKDISYRYSDEGYIKEIDLYLLFEDGTECNIKESKEAPINMRYVNLYTKEEIMKCDFQANTLITNTTKKQVITSYEDDNPLKTSQISFFNCIENNLPPKIGIEKGLSIIKKCLDINELIKGEDKSVGYFI